MHKGYLAFKFRQHRASAGFVTLGIVLFAAVMLLAYSEFDIAGMLQGAQGVPDILRAMAGAEVLLAWDISAFLGMVWRHPLVLVIVIGYAISLGSGFAASEIGEKTADLVFARPVTRPRLLYNHLCVASGLLLVMTALFSLAVFMVANALGLEPPGLARFAQAGVQYFVFVWTVLLLSYLVGAVAIQGKAVLAIVGGVLSAMYAVELVGGLWTAFEPLMPFSLFTYLTPAGALIGDPTALMNTLTMLAVAAVALAITHVLMQRRDL